MRLSFFIVSDECISAGVDGCCELDGVESAEHGIAPAKDARLFCNGRGNHHEIEVLPVFEKFGEFPRQFCIAGFYGFRKNFRQSQN